jgi:hypothetical protein
VDAGSRKEKRVQTKHGSPGSMRTEAPVEKSPGNSPGLSRLEYYAGVRFACAFASLTSRFSAGGLT